MKPVIAMCAVALFVVVCCASLAQNHEPSRPAGTMYRSPEGNPVYVWELDYKGTRYTLLMDHVNGGSHTVVLEKSRIQVESSAEFVRPGSGDNQERQP